MNVRQRKPRVTWLGRFWRGRRPDRNPLRRASDRAESAVLAVCAAAFLLGAPFAAMATGAWAHGAAERQQAVQQASRHQVPAIVLNTPRPPAIEDSTAQPPEAKARWTAPDGTAVTAEVPVPYGTRAGATVRIWVTRDGAPTQAPLLDSQVFGQAGLAETGAVMALALVLGVTGAAARRALDKRRMAAWSAEWRAAGPRWTTRA